MRSHWSVRFAAGWLALVLLQKKNYIFGWFFINMINCNLYWIFYNKLLESFTLNEPISLYIKQRFYRIYCLTIVSRFHNYQKQINLTTNLTSIIKSNYNLVTNKKMVQLKKKKTLQMHIYNKSFIIVINNNSVMFLTVPANSGYFLWLDVFVCLLNIFKYLHNSGLQLFESKIFPEWPETSLINLKLHFFL